MVCGSLGHLAGNLELIPQAGASAEASEPMGNSRLGGRVALSASSGVESCRLRGQEARSGEGEVVKSGALGASGPRGGLVPGAGPGPVLAEPAGAGGQRGPGVSAGGALPAWALGGEGPSLPQEQAGVQSTAHHGGSQDWDGDPSLHPGL